MITVRKGNILKMDTGFIVHGCNALGVMGGGIAAQVAREFPEAYAVYDKKRRDSGLTLGDISVAVVESYVGQPLVIINAITQQDVGTHKRQVNYEAIAECFDKAARWAIGFNQGGFIEGSVNVKPKLSFPLIGAGLAGGDWAIISMIIDRVVSDEMCDKELWLYDAILADIIHPGVEYKLA